MKKKIDLSISDAWRKDAATMAKPRPEPKIIGQPVKPDVVPKVFIKWPKEENQVWFTVSMPKVNDRKVRKRAYKVIKSFKGGVDYAKIHKGWFPDHPMEQYKQAAFKIAIERTNYAWNYLLTSIVNALEINGFKVEVKKESVLNEYNFIPPEI